MFKAVFLGLGLALVILVADEAQALGGDGTTKASYNVSIKGIRAGRLTISSQIDGANYQVSGLLKSTGIVAAFAQFKLATTATGQLKGDLGLTPRRYSEDRDDGKGQSSQSITYSGGVPKVANQAPAPALAAHTQGGTIDPMSAIFAAFRDQTAATLCKADHIIYDGKRRTRLRLKPGPDPMTCAGTYSRLGGFSPAKLAKGTHFPMTLQYAAQGDIFQLQTLTVQSVRGRAVFSRR